MQRSSAALVGSTLALLLTGAGTRANSLPPNISVTENWVPAQTRIYADGFSTGNDHYVAFTGDFALTLSISTTNALHPTGIQAAALQAVSSAPDQAHQDTINSDYTLSVVLEDNPTLHFTTLFFHGHLMGGIWQHHSDLQNTFGPDATQTVTLDGKHITVTLNSFTQSSISGTTTAAPKSASESGSGADSGPRPECRSRPGTGGGPGSGGGPHDSPEPSTLLLSFLGLSALGGGAWWWRGRRAAAAGA